MPKGELKRIDISDKPELIDLADEVRRTNEARVLQRGNEDVSMLLPVAPKEARRVPRGKPFTKDDPLWRLVGIAESDGPTDVAESKHRYLADAYADLHVPNNG
jgi:hypothetical protein